MLPGVILASIGSFFIVRRQSLPKLQKEPNMAKKKEIEIWKKTANKLKQGYLLF